MHTIHNRKMAFSNHCIVVAVGLFFAYAHSDAGVAVQMWPTLSKNQGSINKVKRKNTALSGVPPDTVKGYKRESSASGSERESV